MSDDTRAAAPAATAGGRDFQDLVTARLMSRRNLLVGGALVAAQFALSPAPAASAQPKAQPTGQGFDAVPVDSADRITVPAGYTVQTLAPGARRSPPSVPPGGRTAATPPPNRRVRSGRTTAGHTSSRWAGAPRAAGAACC